MVVAVDSTFDGCRVRPNNGLRLACSSTAEQNVAHVHAAALVLAGQGLEEGLIEELVVRLGDASESTCWRRFHQQLDDRGAAVRGLLDQIQGVQVLARPSRIAAEDP